jgi:hypothetical protein
VPKGRELATPSAPLSTPAAGRGRARRSRTAGEGPHDNRIAFTLIPGSRDREACHSLRRDSSWLAVSLTRHVSSRIVIRVFVSGRGTTETGGEEMAGSRRRATATQTEARRAGAGAEEGRIDPAFHRAILKIAIELRKPDARGYDELVAETIRAMKLDAAAFRRYLGENGARNMSLLLATARAFGL